MTLTSLSPEARQYIDEQIKAGRFPTAEAVLEDAINRVRCDNDDDLDDQTVAAINEAESQADRGEGMDFEAFKAHFNKKIGRE